MAEAVLNPVKSFFGGFADSISPLMDAYFSFENQKQGLELANAELQQARLQNAISTEQQVFRQAQDNMSRAVGGVPSWVPLAAFGVVGVVVAVAVLK